MEPADTPGLRHGSPGSVGEPRQRGSQGRGDTLECSDRREGARREELGDPPRKPLLRPVCYLQSPPRSPGHLPDLARALEIRGKPQFLLRDHAPERPHRGAPRARVHRPWPRAVTAVLGPVTRRACPLGPRSTPATQAPVRQETWQRQRGGKHRAQESARPAQGTVSHDLEPSAGTASGHLAGGDAVRQPAPSASHEATGA